MRRGWLLSGVFASMLAGADIQFHPSSVRPGRAVTFQVVIDPCTAAEGRMLAGDSLSVSGDGVALKPEQAVVTDCTLSLPAEVAKDATIGDRQVIIYKSGRKETLATKRLEVVDPQSGPIPPGLAPQVDLMWNVSSELTCKDQFGARIARYYYCVEVMLGNNSGYALLLSGVGFLRELPWMAYKEGNSSYLQVRSVLQREQVVSGRNITLRALQAAGMVIAGFVPFAGSDVAKGRVSLWASIVGNVIAGAYDNFWPDRTIRQLGNLDDAALRDGKLVPNNSPVKFTIFVERESIFPLLAGPDCQTAYGLHFLRTELARTESDAKLAKARMDSTSLRVLEEEVRRLDKLIAQLRIDLEAGLKRSQESGTADIGKLKETINACAEGKTPRGGTGFNLLGRGQAPSEGDLLAVRSALGKMILVGDQIEYKQRIRVDASASVEEQRPNPQINGVLNDVKAVQGETVESITLIGRWLRSSVVTATDCNGCTFTATPNEFGTLVSLNDFSVPASFTGSTITLHIHTGASAPALFKLQVTAKKPELNPQASPSPLLIDAGKPQVIEATLTGKFLAGAKTSATVTLPDSKVLPVEKTEIVAAEVTSLKLKVHLSESQAVDGAALKIAVETRGGRAEAKTDLKKNN